MKEDSNDKLYLFDSVEDIEQQLDTMINDDSIPWEKIKVLHLVEYVQDKQVSVLYGFIISNVLQIDYVYTNKDYRNQGIATTMVKKAVENALNNGYKKIITVLKPYNNAYMLESIMKTLGFNEVCIDNDMYFEYETLDNYRIFVLNLK